jgi:CheY-like chemotaxis protein
MAPSNSLGGCTRDITERSERRLKMQKAMETNAPVVESYGSTVAHILVVDDVPVNRMVVLGQLKRLGYRADACANGREAVEALQDIQYDLVLMDCHMPEMDGFEASAEIRRREGSDRHTLIIALSATSVPADRGKCLAAGMDDYLSKPVMADVLKDMLDRWLEPTKAAKHG